MNEYKLFLNESSLNSEFLIIRIKEKINKLNLLLYKLQVMELNNMEYMEMENE